MGGGRLVEADVGPHLEAPAALAFVPSLTPSLSRAVALALCWPEVLPGGHLGFFGAEMDKKQRWG